MASSSLAEDLLCPICLALFQEPQMLGCGHNFCLACLRSCLAREGGKEEAPCPECRLPFQLQDLAPNRALASLARKLRGFQWDPEEPFPGALLKEEEAFFCQEHQEPLKLFCLQDRLPLCVICRDLPRHHRHRFLPTKNALDYAQGKLKPYKKLLQRKLAFIISDESVQEKEIAKLESCTEDILGDISSGFELLHQTLHEKEESFKRSLQEIKEKNLEEMNDVLNFIKEDRNLYTEKLTKIKVALRSTDHLAFLKDFKDLMGKVKKYPPHEEENGESSGNDEEREASDIVKDDDQQEEEEEEVEEEDNKNDDRVEVIVMDPALVEFRDSLDFEAWKEILLKQISTWQEDEEERETLDESESDKEEDYDDKDRWDQAFKRLAKSLRNVKSRSQN
ncbi:nuclear factor 7, brain-like [Sceloporus undulatus]|uniref:nuclear factor 7, brain-like n=1 Tax=Sceloporus undulatus TaxID=8520 RepID=UPI001C4AFFF6|nr:nuclear factor 7, brain-like [Sceloporus undulatus]